jgi:geranylgeranyl pyrophosphate synthase
MTDRCRSTPRTGAKTGPAALLARVRALVEEQARAVLAAVGAPEHAGQLLPGKLLRSRFAARAATNSTIGFDDLATVCAAIEMTHTASLCHDDVIDNALLRRSLPTLWRKATPSAAVLIGDVLLCHAATLVASCAGGRYLVPYLAKVTEVCTTEARQELILRGRRIDPADCLAVARGKTGPLFAFLGAVAAGRDERLAAALEESGYRLGTAYQLADDLLDVNGQPETAGKTLGTDRDRGKFTLPQSGATGVAMAAEQVRTLLAGALALLAAWPTVQEAVQAYIEADLAPAIERQNSQTGLCLTLGGRG